MNHVIDEMKTGNSQEHKEESVPGYAAMFKNIKSHINDREGLLAKRVLLIIWPALVYVFLITVLTRFNIEEKAAGFIWLAMFFLLPFALLYIFALTHIFSIEKLLWIDAYGDEKKLKSEESFKIAKKLFIISFKLRIYIFFRFYFLPLTAYLAALIWIIYLLSKQIYIMNIWQFILTYIVLGPVLIWSYYFYLKIKLRYVWFIFLDTYEKNMKFHSIFFELNKLNEINKKDAFKKSLVATLGTDVVQNATQVTVGTFFAQICKIGPKSDVFGKVANTYSNELINQTASLVKLAANYVLYQYSRDQLYGSSQKVNNNIYLIAE